MLVIKARVSVHSRISLHTNAYTAPKKKTRRRKIITDHILLRQIRVAFRVTSVPEPVGYIVL